MKISVCMIVKNEEEQLAKCLQSISPYVAEIIIVDTGSTDRTKEIACSFTNKVYDFVWCNDFSAARNYSLAQVTNDWVLILDADEIVVDFNLEQVRMIKRNNNWVGRMKRINIFSDKSGEKYQIERISRLFDRNLYHYEGIIHEQVVRKDGLPHETVDVAITAEHVGYTQKELQRTAKISRNITLLQQALSDHPDDPYLLYQLGKSYYLDKNFKSAATCFRQALALPLNWALDYVEELVESYGYALLNSGSYGEALCLVSYEEYYDDRPDYLFVMGLVYLNNGQLDKAVASFTQCLCDKAGKIEGVNSFLPNYNLGVIYECLGEFEQAKDYYSRCGHYPLALNRLQLLK